MHPAVEGWLYLSESKVSIIIMLCISVLHYPLPCLNNVSYSHVFVHSLWKLKMSSYFAKTCVFLRRISTALWSFTASTFNTHIQYYSMDLKELVCHFFVTVNNQEMAVCSMRCGCGKHGCATEPGLNRNVCSYTTGPQRDTLSISWFDLVTLSLQDYRKSL